MNREQAMIRLNQILLSIRLIWRQLWELMTGEYQLEAYRSINNDRILFELSEGKNSANLGKISQLHWVSIGQPMFVKMPYVVEGLMNSSMNPTTGSVPTSRCWLWSIARNLRLSLNVNIIWTLHRDQITNLVLSKFECKLTFDRNGQKGLLTGRVTDFWHFPLQMDFDAPHKSIAREFFLKHRRNFDLKFECVLGTKGKLTKTNTLSITPQQIQDFGLEANLFGTTSAKKNVFVSKFQLAELATEMYSKLNILEEYEMPEHQFSEAFVHGLIDQITSKQFSQVLIDKALSSLSKYGFDVSEDLSPDVIERDLGSILTVRKNWKWQVASLSIKMRTKNWKTLIQGKFSRKLELRFSEWKWDSSQKWDLVWLGDQRFEGQVSGRTVKRTECTVSKRREVGIWRQSSCSKESQRSSSDKKQILENSDFQPSSNSVPHLSVLS